MTVCPARTQGGALRELGEPLTMRELAARMCREPPNASYVVDRMEKSGWVERRPHPTDRRAKQLVLTPSGTELRERLMARLARGGPLAHLSGEERAALEEALLRAVCEDRPQDTQEGQTPKSSKE
ncbi:MarR family winged helix-turn-helix transcriptional regulator [Nocardiopsis lucentensis]|uniref:MarR family winged helix-turn-helix transcriptional regulator n=1 Tax=Nocardiopsis lucentensis TaxID=53441 RepID=UPI00034D2AC7|nr:MarR family transcriptional regulator [Nocardiopsis lucentensis]